jgi:hypothetical protein
MLSFILPYSLIRPSPTHTSLAPRTADTLVHFCTVLQVGPKRTRKGEQIWEKSKMGHKERNYKKRQTRALKNQKHYLKWNVNIQVGPIIKRVIPTGEHSQPVLLERNKRVIKRAKEQEEEIAG